MWRQLLQVSRTSCDPGGGTSPGVLLTKGTATATAIAKATRRLIPFLCLCYVVNFLDRVNVGFAALAMNEDLGFTPSMFGIGAGIFFVGYILLEIPSNLALQRFGARIWIARIMISWGIIATAMALVDSETSFYVMRFLLGVAEAGFFPGIILYLTYWFPARERARIVSLFMTAAPLATVVGGPASGALLELHGLFGLKGWQWLFIIEGLPAVKSFAEVGEAVDFAYIAVGAAQVPKLIASGAGKVRYAQVMSSGFGEVEEGRALERELVEAAQAAGTRVLGPNCLGVYSPRGKLAFIGGASPEPGPVGVITQSGGLGVDMILRGQNRGLRYSGLVTLGNSADQQFPCFRVSNHRRRGASAFRILNDDRLTAFHYGHAAIGCS